MSRFKNEIYLNLKDEKKSLVWGVSYEFGEGSFNLNVYDYKNKDELFNAIDQLVKNFKAGYQEGEE